MSDIVLATEYFRQAFEVSFGQEIPVAEYDMDLVEKSKMVIFPGGQDINPKIYGQEYTHSFGYSDHRDDVEMEILALSLKLGKKILGVCRGHQLINAYLGGDMVQDLYQDLKIRHGGGHELVYLTQESIIRSFFKHVNSIHHQGVTKPGDNLVATSEFNGVLESCESTDGKIITVQFHPEFMNHMSEGKKFFSYLKEWKNNGE